jgi:hypothetical protein
VERGPLIGLDPAGDGAPAAPRSGQRRRIVAGAALVLLVVSAVGAWLLRQGAAASAATAVEGAPSVGGAPVVRDSGAVVPAGVRVRVRVLNGTATRGLGRRAAFLLRDHGFDVVDWDSDATSDRAETLIEVHAGGIEWGERARRAIGVGRVASRPDSLRLLELTVRLGRDWRPPAESFRP